jgi:predicted nucleic acid-binding protein
MRVFLDTNILIDLLDAERPNHKTSTDLMRAVQGGQVQACISAISIVNAIYVLRKVMPTKDVATYLLRMLDTVELSRLEVQDLRNALSSGWSDLEDAIQFHSALASGHFDAIVSYDADMKGQDILPVETPPEVLGKLGQ